MEKSPRFFCENCNAEVKRDSRFCNKCGHFFASVKCPACGKVGGADIFKNGCPLCGYAMGASDSSTISEVEKSDTKNPKLSYKSKKQIKNAFNIAKKKNKQKEEGLPFWIYAITITFLIAVLLSLSFYISN